MSEFEKYVNGVLATICGKQNLLNFRYLQFLMIQSDNQNMPQEYSDQLKTLQTNIIQKTIGILGSSLLLNMVISSKVQIKGKTFLPIMLDFAWYAATLYIYLYAVQSPLRQSNSPLLKLQNELICRYNQQYLRFMRQNSDYYGIHIDFQTRNMNLSEREFQMLMQNIRNLKDKNNEVI